MRLLFYRWDVHLLRTSKMTTAWWDARARPDSLTMVGAVMPRSRHTSCACRLALCQAGSAVWQADEWCLPSQPWPV